MIDLTIHIATLNGTGSLSANEILTRVLFREGFPVGSYNFFPSNIAGLPCTYTLRINSSGYISYNPEGDILINLNPKTLNKDLQNLKPSGILVTDKKNEKYLQDLSFKGTHLSLPITEAVNSLPKLPLRLKKLFRNMIYVGLVCEWLNISKDSISQTVADFFQRAGKSNDIANLNKLAINKGCELGKQNPISLLNSKDSSKSNNHLHQTMNNIQPLFSQKNSSASKKPIIKDDDGERILIDGNTAVALGALSAGCQLLSWYPITPSSSLAESFEKIANKYQKTKEGQRKFVVFQAEDELAAIHHVLGAGWAGLRAMTATSGPGLSLMAEGAGLAYFAEVPAVLCDVQRAGPSTGLPTRTQQGDLLSACFLSHGDAKHPVLIPGTVEESFSFAFKAFDLAEQTQTLVILLMDLDLGMNLHASPLFQPEKQALKRGKVLNKEDLNKRDFARYRDVDQDGVSYRALPGTAHFKAGYFTRGSGHNEKAQYTEDPKEYSFMLDKLKKKWETIKSLVPNPIIESEEDTPLAFVTFGNNENVLREVRDILKKKGIKINYMRIRSYPFSEKVGNFLKSHSHIFVVEQNREGQLKQLLNGEFPEERSKMKSILQYDGRPFFVKNVLQQLEKLTGKTQ
ncbi:MAG: 2-oxoacid:acceptor oxidoreductase family protein [Bdellovibrionales bacterium]|nr:2-oxoacid:acceptor oxidoreductase family protein [Bdellovibrionales bacterium]